MEVNIPYMDSIGMDFCNSKPPGLPHLFEAQIVGKMCGFVGCL